MSSRSPSSRSNLLAARAHGMRFSPTYSEALLWSRLRARKLGVTFRRQAVIGSSIFDFVAPAARLIVEVDGDAYHSARAGADRHRDEKLGRLGYRVVRVPASLVERHVEAAAEMVRAALGHLKHCHARARSGGE